jgi:antitoxin CcdA
MVTMRERPKARRRPVNLSIREDLVAAARQLGLNLSQAAEGGLEQAVRKAREAEWLRENAEAIEAHNRWIEEHGLPLRPVWQDE